MSENLDNGLSANDTNRLLEAVMDGMPLAEAVGLDKDVLEGLYGLGYNLYNAGDHENAEIVFQALCLYDFNDPRFWNGLGATRQAQEKYSDAVDAYSFAMFASSLGDPAPIFHSGVCFLKSGDLEAAVTAFESLEALIDPAKADQAALWKKASSLLEIINQRKDGSA
jgi:type III secretion system low calcium response chaperone LcrH/SycD